jgi:uncharacterized protein YeaO (DUF488 family)
MTEQSRIRVKRVYAPPARGDGVRILVDRLWPRGQRKDDVQFDQWRKDLAPTAPLRQYYGHRRERFAEFTRRYRTELRSKAATAAIEELIDLTRRHPVTLLTASSDVPHSHAAVLADHLGAIITRRTQPRQTT